MLVNEYENDSKNYGRVVPANKLHRSTVYRYQITNEKQDSREYGIKQVELVSEYSLKSLNSETKQSPHTVVSSRLIFIEKKDDEEMGKHWRFTNEQETLLYNPDLETFEKLFIMNGDEIENTQKVHQLSRKVNLVIKDKLIKFFRLPMFVKSTI